MSSGARVAYERGVEFASYVWRLLDLDDGDCSIVGSLRRKESTVGDVELLCPLPRADEPDTLLARIRECFVSEREPASLFCPDNKPVVAERGVIVKGANAGFKYCQLRAYLRDHDQTMTVELWRYDTGPRGNQGWQSLIRTGPRQFGQACLSLHLRNRDGAKFAGRHKASDGGYPLDADGRPIPVPDERAAFKLLGIPYIEPERRASKVSAIYEHMRSVA